MPFLLVFAEITHSQPVSLHLTETLVIGEDQSEEMAYIFGQPDKVQADADGNIYVSDRSDHTIRVFDSEGTYQHSIGGRGRGPGEFVEITDFHLQTDGNLVALDRAQSKIVIFDFQGNVVREHPLPRYIEGSAIYIFPTANDDQYFLGYINIIQQEQNGHFLHLFDSTFENKLREHYDLFDTYFDGTNPLEERLSKSYSKIATLFQEGQIAIVPNIYTGTIHSFHTENLTMSMMGEPIEEFYEEMDWEQRHIIGTEDSPGGLVTMSGQTGRFLVRMKATNFGLVGNQQFLVQFYGEFHEGDITPYVNIFSSDGTLLLNENLSDSDYPYVSDMNSFLFLPAFLDDHHNLYVIDFEYQDLYPAIRVFETNLDEFLEE